jgi:lysylphosphatidylglycerol synthetase-like protein (DUF2156 family)
VDSPRSRLAEIDRRFVLRRSAEAPQPAFGARLPLLAGQLTAVVALINLASTLTPSLSGRLALIRFLEPLDDVRVAHVAALPVGLALLVAARQLARGSRRAVNIAIALLVIASVLNVIKGLDVEEAGLSAAAAALLWRFRDQFAMTARAARPRVHRADESDRARAAAVSRAYGTGTLGAFALRSDLARIWSPDGRAFAAYRIEAGALMLAGDPVGDPASHGAVLDEAIRLAQMHGLTWGAVGVGDGFAVVAQRRGLRRLYVGDEAIVATGTMDMAGRARKGLRTSMNRIARLGYVGSLHRIGDLDAAALAELQRISDAWRNGADERGFSMSHDQLADPLLPDAMVVIARDADGVIRGFLHFMPVFGAPQVSLGLMCRDRETPNGLTEFLILRSAELLADEGINEMSLNFAAFAGLRRNPRHAGERAVVRVLLALDHFFKVGGLELFNAKFDPRWERRHLLFSRPASMPRAVIAALVCEGYLPAWPGRAATLPPPVSGRVAPAA